MRSGFKNNKCPSRGFTLVEMLVAAGVFLLILGLTLVITTHLTRLTSENTSSLSAFQEARTAFETMNRMISQSVLNTYWDYDDPSDPKAYLRASELHFILGPAADITNFPDTAGSAIFFQAPLGITANPSLKSLPDLLNSAGFYIRFSASDDLPDFLAHQKANTFAWRLWMLLEPTEDLTVYSLYDGNPQKRSDLSWFQQRLQETAKNHVLANNAILLIIRAGYMDTEGKWEERYVYNSRGMLEATDSYPQKPETHQLPPILYLTLVVIDQPTADKLRILHNDQIYNLIPPDKFSDASQYHNDLEDLQTHLDSRPLEGIPINYRIFETTINPAASKWSQ